ncbi:LamG-like jellyroll fold domain-containing protein [Streptomyces sp. NPDC002886]|uniref:LamG-like jellyroll fold domain-containing protein n=1 Tax=Streptomyces sp. NPDC002886 TaxID=3364667 RepID=UPI00368545FC
MTDGTDRPHSPQPEPAPEGGGYGFPPGIPAPGGYGFPPGSPDRTASGDDSVHPQSGGYGYPPAGGYGYPPGPPAPGTFGPPLPFPEEPGPNGPQAPNGPYGLNGPDLNPPPVTFGDGPDWEAMADRSAAERRKKRLWMVGGAVTVLLLLAGGGAFVLLRDGKTGAKDVADNAPSSSPSVSAPASGSPDPDASPSKGYSPTVSSDVSLLRDGVGKTSIRMGPEATVPKVTTRYELTLKGNPNSYAQATEPGVDTTKSFTLAARVNNASTAKGTHVVMSQGTGEAFSIELGADEVDGKQAWVFRVRTTEKSATPTVVTVSSTGKKTVKTWAVLLAVYDAEKKMIHLYVDGKQAGEAAVPGIWQNSGPLQLGRARHQDAWAGAFKGAMNQIRIYESAFTPEQAAAHRKGDLDAAGRATATHAWVTG